MRARCLSRGGARKSLALPAKAQPATFSARMRRKIDQPQARRIYSRRLAIVEPVFANLRSNKRLDRFTYRGTQKVNTQWLLYCLVHNFEKIAHLGRIYGAKGVKGQKRGLPSFITCSCPPYNLPRIQLSLFSEPSRPFPAFSYLPDQGLTTTRLELTYSTVFVGRVRSELFEPCFIDSDVLNHFGLGAEAKFFELVGELVAVNEVDWRRAVSGSFLDGVARESAGRNRKDLCPRGQPSRRESRGCGWLTRCPNNACTGKRRGSS